MLDEVWWKWNQSKESGNALPEQYIFLGGHEETPKGTLVIFYKAGNQRLFANQRYKNNGERRRHRGSGEVGG